MESGSEPHLRVLRVSPVVETQQLAFLIPIEDVDVTPEPGHVLVLQVTKQRPVAALQRLLGRPITRLPSTDGGR